jgi:hypothetical protein
MLGADAVTRGVVDSLDEDDPSMRVLAIYALETLKAREALPRLMSLRTGPNKLSARTPGPGRSIRGTRALHSCRRPVQIRCSRSTRSAHCGVTTSQMASAQFGGRLARPFAVSRIEGAGRGGRPIQSGSKEEPFPKLVPHAPPIHIASAILIDELRAPRPPAQ